MCWLCTQRCWLGVARHADGCQMLLGLRATRYWLVKKIIIVTMLKCDSHVPSSCRSPVDCYEIV